MNNLRIIFMGTPEFAVAPLKAMLEEGFDVVAVITAPDKPAGRGRSLRQSPVKEFALEKNLPVLQPVNLKDPAFVEDLRSYRANLQVVIAFRMLPEIVWNMPALGTFNLHASLLPQYRGAAPINRAIINGETETGLTTFFLTHEIDTGNVLFQESIAIDPDDTAGSLHDKLSIAGAVLVTRSLRTISEGSYTLRKQDDMIREGLELMKAPKIFREDCIIHWDNPAEKIHNLVRGLCPVPGATTTLYSPADHPFSMKLFKTSIEKNEYPAHNGDLITDGKTYMLVKTADEFIRIHELQLEGKKRLTTSEFLRGFPLSNEWKMK
jgi:methionyl-tRNA formyltransferase